MEKSLDVTEDLPEHADELDAAGVDPGKMTDALAAEGKTVTKTINSAMGTSRVKDHAGASLHLDADGVTWDGTTSVDDVVDIAKQNPRVRREQFKAELEEAKTTTRKTASGEPGTTTINELKEKYENRDFESEEEEIAYIHHAKNTAKAARDAVSEEKFQEYNKQNLF